MEINQDVLEKLKSIYLYHLEQYELTDNLTHYGYLQGMLYTLHKLGISWDFIDEED
jgi:hypothetical protein